MEVIERLAACKQLLAADCAKKARHMHVMYLVSNSQNFLGQYVWYQNKAEIEYRLSRELLEVLSNISQKNASVA